MSDVVGYSRLTGADEDRILARLRALRSDLIDPTIAVHHGRVVKRTGDGSIVEFRSVVDAVNCAIEVQRAMVERNAGVAPDKRIEFRIGIHLGDVVEESDGDLMGDGVNIAARLEGIAKPGAICLSEDAYRQVKGRLDLAVSDLGPTQLKNIAEPIRVYSLEVGQPAQSKPLGERPSRAHDEAARRPASPRWPRSPPRSLSPFSQRAPTRGVRARSATVRRFRREDKLAKRPAAFDRRAAVREPERRQGSGLFRRRDHRRSDDRSLASARQLRHRPQHRLHLQGQAGRRESRSAANSACAMCSKAACGGVGETITVNAQLISTETGAHVWADRFDGERSQLGQLQVEFVSRLANSLGVELVKAESLRAMRERPNNPDAVDLAMQGWATYNKGFAKANVDAAIPYFERALQLDPQLTRAQLGLAWGLVDRAFSFRGGNETIDLPRAEALLRSALSRESNSAWAHFIKADVLAYGKKQSNDALSELDVVIDNDRNFAAAYALRGAALIFIGEAKKAIPEVENALRLSPRDPLRNWWEFRICHAYAHLAEWERAVEWCQKSIATNAEFWIPYVDLTAANGWLGRETEAKAAINGLHKLMPGFTVQNWANIKWSENPQFQREYARIVDGLRKAGLPEE